MYIPLAAHLVSKTLTGQARHQQPKTNTMIRKATAEIMAQYRAEFKKHREAGKWTPAKSVAVVTSILSQLKDDKDKPLLLTDEEQLIVAGVLNPTSKTKLATINHVLGHHGIEIDDTIKTLIAKLFSATSVQQQIEDAKKPSKLRLKDLMDSEPEPETTAAVEEQATK